MLHILDHLQNCHIWGGGGGGGWGGGVFIGGREMKVFNMVFQDLGENMVGKRYFQH